MVVAEDLHFDVARVVDEFLDQHPVIAEAGLGLTLGACQCGLEILHRRRPGACRARRRRQRP